MEGEVGGEEKDGGGGGRKLRMMIWKKFRIFPSFPLLFLFFMSLSTPLLTLSSLFHLKCSLPPPPRQFYCFSFTRKYVFLSRTLSSVSFFLRLPFSFVFFLFLRIIIIFYLHLSSCSSPSASLFSCFTLLLAIFS